MRAFFLSAVVFALGMPASSLPAASIPVRTGPARSTDMYSRAIELFGGHAIDAARFENTVEGFGKFLAACGVTSIGAAELTTPHHADVAARLGFRAFLPPKQWWARGVALALLSERLSEAAGQKVAIRNWWRPAAYNSDPTVGGAKNGDHPTANALDLDYASATGRIRAEQFLRKLQRSAPWLNLSLGLGPQTTHVGIGSPRGHREWHYSGWTPAPAP
jgi:hypothetical protein